jgi:hypothetical protein
MTLVASEQPHYPRFVSVYQLMSERVGYLPAAIVTAEAPERVSP